jgi:hypothetical protein
MSTEKKVSKTKTKRRKTTKSGLLKKIDLQEMVKGVTKPALFLVGLWGGRQIALLIDKNSQTVNGFLGSNGTTILKPVVTGLIGLTVSQVVKNEHVKIIGYGVAAYGGLTLLKDVWNKDILAGIGDDVRLPSQNRAFPKNANIELPDLEEAARRIEKELENADVSSPGASGVGQEQTEIY